MALDLTTEYLGLKLKNPLIVSSSRLSENIGNIKKMEAAGAGAIVMYSVFEEEVRYDDEFVEYFLEANTESFAEALTYFPHISKQESFLNQHLYILKQAVEAVKIPIIGSLNAVTHEGWIDYALQMQETGIKALELNLYHLPVKPLPGAAIEKTQYDIIKELKSKLKIPLVVKLSPFFTSVGDVLCTLDKDALIDGAVLFNRFYAPDVDLKAMSITNNIELSHSYETRLPMRWIALLRNKVKCSLAASTGVQNSDDFIKYILVGADAVACASCMFKNGIDYLKEILAGTEKWMQEKGYQSIKSITGLVSKGQLANLSEFERAQYMRALRSYK